MGVFAVQRRVVEEPPGIVPGDLGLPPKFRDYWHSQLQVAYDIVADGTRFAGLSAGPGTGKTLVCATVAKLLDCRALFVMGAKALQQQWLRDFSSIGLRDVRGQANYRCVALDRGGELEGHGAIGSTCSDGPCRVGVHCSMRNGAGCLYYDDIALARQSQWVVTNYAMWLALGKHSDPHTIGEFGLIVLDEGHSAADWLTDFCAVTLKRDEIHALLGMDLPPIDEGVAVWSEWAKDATIKATIMQARLRETVKARVGDVRRDTRTLLRLTTLVRDLGEMAKARQWRRTEDTARKVEVPGSTTDWIAFETPDTTRPGAPSISATFTPVWAHQYAEEYLFRGIPKVVLSSGTLLPSVTRRLGIPEKQWSWHEVQSTFDPRRRPVVYVPTTRVDKNMTEGQKRLLVNRIDQIVDARLDRKGIIPSVSYDRAHEIVARSKYGGKRPAGEKAVLVTHERGGHNFRDAVEAFKRAKPPCVLVSPLLVEGIDLPYDQCRFVIIPKVPFSDSRDPLFKARNKADSGYRAELAAMKIIQSSHRGMRAADDASEVFVVDDHFSYLRKQTEWPQWFKASWRQEDRVPPPMNLVASTPARAGART